MAAAIRSSSPQEPESGPASSALPAAAEVPDRGPRSLGRDLGLGLLLCILVLLLILFAGAGGGEGSGEARGFIYVDF